MLDLGSLQRWQTDTAGPLIVGLGMGVLAGLTWGSIMVKASDPTHVEPGLALLMIPTLGVVSGTITRRYSSMVLSCAAAVLGWSVSYVLNYGTSPIPPRPELGSGANVFEVALTLLPVIAVGHAVGVWATARQAEAARSPQLGAYPAAGVVGLPTDSVFMEFAPIGRRLRATMVLGGLALWLLLVVVGSPLEQNGQVLPRAYPILGVACFLEAQIAVGLAWCVIKWRPIPIVVRALVAGLLGFFTGAVILLGIQYLLGTPVPN